MKVINKLLILLVLSVALTGSGMLLAQCPSGCKAAFCLYLIDSQGVAHCREYSTTFINPDKGVGFNATSHCSNTTNYFSPKLDPGSCQTTGVTIYVYDVAPNSCTLDCPNQLPSTATGCNVPTANNYMFSWTRFTCQGVGGGSPTG